MHSNFPKKPIRDRNTVRYGSVNNNSNKKSYRGPDHYSGAERRKVLSDITFYNIARFLMGNEVQILTRSEVIEGVLKGFDSSTLCLTKVAVYGCSADSNSNTLKLLLEGKEVHFQDVLMMKVISLNGKIDNVLIDQEISHRKQAGKPQSNEDKDLIPYFGDDEPPVDELKADMSMSIKTDDSCWYHPEDMLKDNEQRLSFKSTFNDNMHEYTTQIDHSDPLLQEKMERADRIAREIESENSSMRRVRQLEDEEDEERDEEMQFSAVAAPHPQPPVQHPPSAPASTPKLNPNAPEFRPRPHPLTSLPLALPAAPPPTVVHLDEAVLSGLSLMPDPALQQHQQQQQQQQLIQRFSVQMPPLQPGQQYGAAPGAQRVLNFQPQWAAVQAAAPVHYMQYQQHPPLGYGAAPRQETGQGLLYSLGQFGGQFFVQQQPQPQAPMDQLAGEMFASDLRHPHVVPAPGLPPPGQQQQPISSYYTQSPHQLLGQPMGGHPGFPHLVFNQQVQQQGSNVGGGGGGYVTSNGRS